MKIVENVVQILTSLIYPLGLLLLVFFCPNVCSVFLRLLSGNLWSFSLLAMAVSDGSDTKKPGFRVFHLEKSSNMAKIWPKMKKSLVQLGF